MTSGDPIQRLRDFIDERWAVIQPREFPGCTELHVRLEEVTPREATWFLESVAQHEHEPPLFTVEDNNKHRSDRYPPNADDSPRGNIFFDKTGEKCSLRLETIVHQAATWRLHDEFEWPRDHLIVESPDVVDADGRKVLKREALDILALEEPCPPQLPSKMTTAAARSRLGVEAKSDKKELDKLVDLLRRCDASVHDEHNKCLGIDVFRPRCFLAVAAGETWYVFRVVERDDRAVLGARTGLDRFCFNR